MTTTRASRRSLWKPENAHAVFRALGNGNYRLYFYGLLVSLVGTWMQIMVEAWLVYRLTQSALWLGVITFCSQGTAFLVSPLAGIIADRRDRRKVLIVTQLVGMTQALILAGLVFTGTVQIWHIALLAVVLGGSNAFDITTRHAFTVDLVGLEHLPSAIGLNSVMFNFSRVIGPVLAGLLMGALGAGSEGWCFFINGLSFFAVVIALLFMNPDRLHRRSKVDTTAAKPLLRQFRVSIDYVLRTPQLRRLILFAAFLSFIGFPYSLLLPVIAKTTLGGGVHTLAWLTAAGGVGSIFGALRRGAAPPKKEALWGSLLRDLAGMGVGFLITGLSHQLQFSMVGVAAIGFFLMGAFPVLSNTVQQEVDDSMRARVLALYNMSFLGATPIGNLIAGSFVDWMGVPAVAATLGTACVVMALVISKLTSSARYKTSPPARASKAANGSPEHGASPSSPP